MHKYIKPMKQSWKRVPCKYQHFAEQSYPSVIGLSNGNFVITWGSSPGRRSQWGVFGQCTHVSGSAIGSEFQVNTYTTGDQSYQNSGPKLASTTTGGFVISGYR